MKKVNLMLLIIALSGLLMSGLASAAFVAVTNQNNGGNASISYVTDDLLRATSFTTGPEWTLLVSADLEVFSRNAIGVEMTFTAAVYDNTASQLPGNVVGVFDDLLFSQSVASRFEDATFVTSGILLQPNTKYWLALGGYGGEGGDYKATSLDTETSTLGWTIGDSDKVTLVSPGNWSTTGNRAPISFTLNVETADAPRAELLYANGFED
jgi:hypothetical protein